MNYLAEILAQVRSRTSWDDRLSHWERPASDSEEAQIERAAAMVRKALAANAWLRDEGVTIAPQGSYFNNTNVRQTADQDLRAIHPIIRVLCPGSVDRAAAFQQLNLVNSPRTFDEVMTRMRREIDAALGAAFGTQNIDMSGKKATRVIELPGSRAPVDVVPTFRYIWTQTNSLGGIVPQEGVSILSKDGKWTNNFPVRHNANGIAKRARTQHRFKKAVRSLKRLRDKLEGMGILQPKECPSFLILLVAGFQLYQVGRTRAFIRGRRMTTLMRRCFNIGGWKSPLYHSEGVQYHRADSTITFRAMWWFGVSRSGAG